MKIINHVHLSHERYTYTTAKSMPKVKVLIIKHKTFLNIANMSQIWNFMSKNGMLQS